MAVVRLAGEMGLARFGTLSIDGTKVRANASKRKAMSYGRMVKEEKRLQAEIKALVGRAGAVDDQEDERYGVDVRGDEIPEELKRREDRLEAIVQAKARLEARQRAMDDARGRKPGQDRNPKGGRPYKRAYGEPEAKAQSNFTDLPIPAKVTNCSAAKLPFVPGKVTGGRSVATRFGYYDGSYGDLPPLALAFRMDSPFSVMR